MEKELKWILLYKCSDLGAATVQKPEIMNISGHQSVKLPIKSIRISVTIF